MTYFAGILRVTFEGHKPSDFMFLGDKVIMKKLIQMLSLLNLVVVFTVVSASAQAEYGSEVEIPFSFKVEGRSYEAGKYIVKLVKSPAGAAAIKIDDPKTGRQQTVFTHRSGEGASDDVKLVFNTIDGEKVLSSVTTPGGGFALRIRRQQREASILNQTPETAFVNAVGDLF